MKKLVKRWIAGVSAAALLVSAVGFDTFTNVFTRTVSADAASSQKNAKSTGFGDLEKDTDKDGYYNTGYGLHTNKTATEVDDGTGRTFDVNLESWYVGENPVDVATILDASGSMAWTVDTLEPLEIDDKMVSDYDGLMKKYNVTNDDLSHIDIDNKTTKLLMAIQNKSDDGYLPQDVVDKILIPTNTDNSKLSYAGYKYYVYEDRSTVSEFVPLGYWDGGEIESVKPIGYYPFDGSLTNEVDGGTEGKLIKRVDSGGTFSDDEVAAEPVKVQFNNGGLDLSETDKIGNVIIDLSGQQLDTAQTITLSFQAYFEDVRSGDGTPLSPIIYFGDGTNTNYVGLFRGRSKKDSNGASRGLYFYNNNSNKAGKDQILNSYYGKWNDCKITINSNKVSFSITNGSNEIWSFTDLECTLNLNSDNLYLILGGNEVLTNGDLDGDNDGVNDIDPQNLKGNYIRNLTISATKKDSTDSFTAEFSLANEDGLTYTDTAGNTLTANYYQQSTGTAFDMANPPVVLPVVYTDNALNLTKTAKNGAVKLDAKPTDNTYTILFKVKSSRKLENDANKDRNEKSAANLFYIGSNDTSNHYYHIGIPSNSDPRHLQFYVNEKKTDSTLANENNVFNDTNFKYVAYVIDGAKINSYFNITKDNIAKKGNAEFTNELDASDINIILAGLVDTYANDFEIFIDDLYIFDEALNDDQLKTTVKNISSGGNIELTDSCGAYHAKTSDRLQDIAQISKSLGANTNIEDRRGWYYVNSHSKWEDIEYCLEGGKQYLGIINDRCLGEMPKKPSEVGGSDETKAGEKDWKIVDPEDDPVTANYQQDNQSIATIPSVYQAALTDTSGDETKAHYKELYEKIIAGNDDTKTFTPEENECSLKFYVDKSGYLRCFFCTGDFSWKSSDKTVNKVKTTTWKYSPRTFCSVVYMKEEYKEDARIKGDSNYGNPTKYEELNYALNQFYQNLARFSDLSNSAIVRFSTHNLIDTKKAEESDNTKNRFKSLIMKDWTNYSDKYSESSGTLERKDYLQDLLVKGENSTDSKESSAKRNEGENINEYPYVMTGGTYTWTGLKAFYDNMVNTEGLNSGHIVYDIANDARDKYLIIFTDGRDNTQDYDLKADGTPNYNTGSNFTKQDYYNIEDYNPYQSEKHTVGVDNHEIAHDGDLAEAWADKLKDEGYTIFCVMLATGSISETANKAEYDRAYNFLLQLAGDKDGIKYPAGECVSVVGQDSTLADEFGKILTKIQQPRNDYIVQDYIDPRFDLIGKDAADGSEVIYHLGAGGKITVKNAAGTTINEATVGNVIDALDKNPEMTSEDCKKLGLAYTPQESYMVNRKPDPKGGYTNGDEGTGYLYYDDVKDMYYLRWTDQIIPMENDVFDTVVGKDDTYLDVWSATIRLKAKDDFIGGNNILTNGNEAGENLVYSDATIENMGKGENWSLYGLTGKGASYREKLTVLSGTDRKINAVDAGGVSQAVYGNGIDIPSSGFPRTTVNVRLLKLNANNLNDVIYMGEVISPTMMLADLEDGYMTGSYYLEYLERYAYRVYGNSASKKPLLDLLNEWLKINDNNYTEKTFTIPYMYLPDPEYDEGSGFKGINNSTGWDKEKHESTLLKFDDLNLQDVTGFITYAWIREYAADEEHETQQMETDAHGDTHDNITKEYVVKNTNQIKYNLKLVFTPLKEEDLPDDFKLVEKFIDEDHFFNIDANGEFYNIAADGKWTIDENVNSNRTHYLKAMVKEQHTYTPHITYVGDKWQLSTTEPEETNKNTYDWDSEYKPVAGSKQLESGKDNSIKGFYTDTPNNVNLLDVSGNSVTDDEGTIKAGSGAPVSLTANTTYVKDVVNGALALELCVRGKYLKQTDSPFKENHPFTFEATRYYDDPNDPLRYGSSDDMKADTETTGTKYQLTFAIDGKTLPKVSDPNDDEIYTIWAKLTQVKVEVSTGNYQIINENPTTDDKTYIGYQAPDALPIGTYVIIANDTTNTLNSNQFMIAKKDTPAGITEDVHFKYLKIDNSASNYKYKKFPDSVYNVSGTAVESTGDDEYLIRNGVKDYSPENIADNNRDVKTAPDTQTVKFYFGTVEKKEVGSETLENTKGVSVKDYLKEHPEDPQLEKFTEDYAKDRLGILLLAADNNALTISKEVTHTNADTDKYKEMDWNFTITIKTSDTEWINNHTDNKLTYTLYTHDRTSGEWKPNIGEMNIPFTSDGPDSVSGIYTLTATLQLKHDQKAVFSNLPDGTWQVREEGTTGDPLYTPHNNAYTYSEEEWIYRKSAVTSENTLTPASQVDFINEFPYELPSTGDIGTDYYIFFGTMLTVASVLFVAWLWYDRRKRRAMHE